MNLGEILYTVILYPLVQIIEIAFMVFDKLFSNTGIAVMGVSFVVTVLCLPLYIVAERWQQLERDTQARLKGGVDRIKAVFKGDEQYMILSTFYRQNHYHPMMALRSSFGLLIQVPFFMAAYSCLSSLPALQGQSFLFIRDMGAPDALFIIGGGVINVLPIAMTAINIAAGAIYTKGFPFKEKAQIYGMALLFLVILYNSPAGLVLYWTMNNVFSLVKNIFYKLKHPVWVLYILMCVGIVLVDYYLLFIHGGFLDRRLALVAVITPLVFAPLIVKFFRFLLSTILSFLVDNHKICLTMFLTSAIILCLLLGFVLPSFVVASSPQEFSFIDNYANPFSFLFNALVQAFGFFVFWPVCLYFLSGNRIKVLFSLVFVLGAIGALVNSFVFAGDYGVLSTTLNFSDASLLNAPVLLDVGNLIVLAFSVVLVFVIVGAKKVLPLIALLQVMGCALLVISVSNSIPIFQEYNQLREIKANSADAKVELEPVFHLSKTEPNIFVIMLDRGMSSFLPYILEERPELKQKFEGFVHYPNTLSFATYTLLGVPPIYGGYEYTPSEINLRSDVPLVEKHNEAILSMPVLFSEHGFDVTTTDPSWANYSWTPDMRIFEPYENINALSLIRSYTDLWFSEHPEMLQAGIRSYLLKRNFLWYSVMRSMPTVLRDIIYNDGFYRNINKDASTLHGTINSYAVLDYLPELTDFTAETGTYTFMVNELTHSPAILQAPDYIPQTKVTDKGKGVFADNGFYHVNISALLLLGEWLDYIKEQGAYNNTRIIIVADHGEPIATSVFHPDFELPVRPEYFNPLLLVKDFNRNGELETDMTFMTNADVPFLSTQGVIDTPLNPFTGTVISMDSKLDGEQGVFVVCDGKWMPDKHDENTFKIADNEWYHVKDNIFVDSNWTQEVPQ